MEDPTLYDTTQPLIDPHAKTDIPGPRIGPLGTVRPRYVDGTDINAFHGGSFLKDPQFTRNGEVWDGSGSSLGFYWRDSSAGDGTVSISLTGGTVGGYAELFCDAAEPTSTARLNAVPSSSSAVFVGGETVRISIRMRKTNNPTLTAAQLTAGGGPATASGVMQSTGDYQALDLDETDINAWTVNEWQNYTLVHTLNGVDAWADPFIYMGAEVALADVSHDLTIQVDVLNVTTASP
jgi:hypothetical protein